MVHEQNQKEILFFIRNMQNAQSNEMLSMRGMIQDQITEETQALMKEREKSKALFLEVVRIGENQGRSSEMISTLQAGLDNRLQVLESKILSGQRSLVSIAQKGDSGLSFINEWNDKLEKRLTSMEANLLTLSREQMKDKDSLNQIENVNLRLSDDVQNLLASLHQDYQQRLDSRVTELVNRIIMEHEDRLRSNEEMRINFEMREKLNSEKAGYEREEMRERHAALESLMRTELQRKEEQVKSLQSIFENQVRGLQNALKQEEEARNQTEVSFKNDVLSLRETFAKEYDLFKGQQSTITQKITEMMKIEIQTRLNSDVDLKNLTSAIASDIVQDMNNFKDSLEIQNKKFSQELKEISAESAQRSQQLSHYIDDEVKKVAEILSKKYQKMKTIFTKLAQQFKNHLVNTQNNRRDVERRLFGAEKGIEDLRVQTYGVIKQTAQQLDNRIRDESQNLQNKLDNQIIGLNDKTNQLEELLNKDFDILKQALDKNRDLFTTRLNQLIEQNMNYHQLHQKSIEQILENSKLLRENVERLEEEMRKEVKRLNELIESVDKRLGDQLIKLRDDLLKRIEDTENFAMNLDQRLTDTIHSISVDIHKINDAVFDLDQSTKDRFNETENSLMFSFKIMESTSDTIDKMQETMQIKLGELEAAKVIDQTLNKVQLDRINNEIGDLLVVSTNINENGKLLNQYNQQEISKLNKDLQIIQIQIADELKEAYQKKIQNVLENIKNENQKVWDLSTKDASKNFKDIDLASQKDPLFSQLNQILITQDAYNKPVLRNLD